MLKRKEFILGAAVGLTFAAAATAGGIIDWPGASAQSVSASGRLMASAGAPGAAFQPPPGAPMSFADIFQQVAPAVVQIDVKTRAPASSRSVTIPGTPFQFQLPPGVPGPNGEPEAQEGLGSGSGFFISADGFIVTNNHVVENATEITVKLSDERELTARLVGRDESTDLAVLKVEGGSFPFVDFETAAQPRVGDWVIAVGNPFGLGGTATAGIVSAQGRDLGQPSSYNDFIQIDAAINRGNSGGPTFDIYGRVIGVNTAIFSPTGGSVGIGFAIPADVAKRITDQLKGGRSIERGYLGVEIISVTPEFRRGLGLPDDFEGAYINSVTPGGPSDRGGLRNGDIVTELNGEAIESSTELTRLVGQAKAGDLLRLRVLRDGRAQSVEIRSGTRPPLSELNAQASDEESGGPPSRPGGVTGTGVAGLMVTPLTAALRSRYDIPETVEGLVITGPVAGSPASRLPFEAGFVILRAGNRPVRTVADFQDEVRAARAAGRDSVFVQVHTPQGNRPIVIDLPDGEGE